MHEGNTQYVKQIDRDRANFTDTSQLTVLYCIDTDVFAGPVWATENVVLIFRQFSLYCGV